MSDFLYNDSERQLDTTLILCIEEHDDKKDPTSIDNRIFIGWSSNRDYYVRGKRQDIGNKEFVPYAFRCKYTDDLYDFIEFTVGKKSKISVTLYNYNNLEGFNDDECTYDFFESYMDKNYEIAAYDNVNLKRSKMIKFLKMLKNTYNWDNEEESRLSEKPTF